MGCHTWFFRPIKENERADDTCGYSQEKFHDDRYTDSDTPHDLFRIGGYPEDYLLSLDETLKFIEDNKNEISHYHDKWKTHLINFWTNNPDGVIEFG